MKRAISVALAGLLYAATVAPASPGEITSRPSWSTAAPTAKPQIVLVAGLIDQGDYENFLQILDLINPDIITFSSPGGRISEGLLIAGEIHKRGLNTLIQSSKACASICALMFLSGKTKYIGYDAQIGIHSSGLLDGTPSIEGTIGMAQYLTSIGTPLDIVAKMEGTPFADMSWLTTEDRDALGIEDTTISSSAFIHGDPGIPVGIFTPAK